MNIDKTKNEILENVLKITTEIGQSQEFENWKIKKLELESELNLPENWQNQTKSKEINQELGQIQRKLENYQKLETELENLLVALEIAEEAEMSKSLKICKNLVEIIQNEKYLSGVFDQSGVMLSIHAGAGGTDANDWAAMLVAMYTSFAKKQNWNLEIVNLSSGEETGVKSILLKIWEKSIGENIYGLLKEEAGVHRLVRISPFNAGKTRETSFALVEVLPLGIEEKFEVKIDEKGGQSVDTTYSAVRLVHIPTGISISSQNQRSQLQNKGEALKILQNRLAIQGLQNQEEFRNELKGVFVSAEWGSQIRSYVLHPYKMVKDHRSNWEAFDTVDFLENGNILEVIWSVKKWRGEN